VSNLARKYTGSANYTACIVYTAIVFGNHAVTV